MIDMPKIVERIDQEIIRSRLSNLMVMMMTDRGDRLEQIAASLEQLPTGAYLIGTGASTVGIIPLSVDEVVIGRAATPVEDPIDEVVDYEVSDALYLGPHEVSRLHAMLRRTLHKMKITVTLVDLNSRCGTFINGEKIRARGNGRRLTHGDIVSLGASQTSTYLYVEIAGFENDDTRESTEYGHSEE